MGAGVRYPLAIPYFLAGKCQGHLKVGHRTFLLENVKVELFVGKSFVGKNRWGTLHRVTLH